MPYRDEIAIVSIRCARAAMRPREWQMASSIVLRHSETSCVVELARVASGYGAIKHERAWFVCPNCGALKNAVGFSYAGVGCRSCHRWRSREYRVTRKAPHVGPITADALLLRPRDTSEPLRGAAGPRAVATAIGDGVPRPYRDEIAIVSLRHARATMTPRQWRTATSITLHYGQIACVIDLARVAAKGAIKHDRVWLVCPTCSAHRNAVAFTNGGIGCRTCQRWRSRERRVRRRGFDRGAGHARWAFDDALARRHLEQADTRRAAHNPRAVDDDWLRSHAAANPRARIPDRIAAWAAHAGRTVSHGAMWNALVRIGWRHQKAHMSG